MRKVYDPEVRAAAMSALLAGQGVSQVAAEYKLPSSTVSRWKLEARKQAGCSQDVGGLLLGYLEENLVTLRAQAIAFRDPSWLRGQDAAAVGVLHGILCDKSIRLLEALEGSGVQATASTNGTHNRVRNHV